MRRFRVVVVLTGLVAVAVFAFAITALVANGGAGRRWGWSATPTALGWVVDSVAPGTPAADVLRPGDRVVDLKGVVLLPWYGSSEFLGPKQIGHRYAVVVEREGERIEATLPVLPGRRILDRRLVYLLVCLVWCGVGLFIGYAKPDDPVARLAFGAAVATGIVFLEVFVVPRSAPAALYQPLHAVLGYHFFYRFPGGVERGKLARGLLWLFYAWCAIAIGLRQPIYWLLVFQGAGSASTWAARNVALLRTQMAITTAMAAPLAIACIGLVATTYRRLRDEDRRRRIRWVVFASAAALSPLLLWTVLEIPRQLGGLSLVPAPVFARVDLLTNAGTVLIPLAVAYAVVRHRVFDIAVVVRRGLQYLLARRALQAVVVLPSVALLVTVITHRDRTIGELLTEDAGYIVLIAVATVSLRFRGPIQHWLDRRFFREQYDREQVLVSLLADLRRLQASGDVAPLVTGQLERSLHPSAIRLWFEGDPDPPPERLLEHISGEGAPMETPLTTAGILPDGVRVAVPLVSTEERVEGVLLLGEKRSEEPYTPSDLSLLGQVARQTAVVRENLVLRERIREEQRIRADVLAHLEPDRVGLLKECPACGACYDAPEERCPLDGARLTLTLPVTRILAGRYRLDALIARGGMGSVYEAVDLRLQRTVAVKLLLDRGVDPEHALRRFRREARAVARLHHPNIVSVYDYGPLHPHGAFLVMERIHGVTLREELQRHGPLDGLEAAAWLEPLLHGLEAAHEEGVIHRDLKPENVARVRPEHGERVVKILDFGVAKLRPIDTTSDHLTAAGAVIGTLGYMSPEQLGGHELDARSDLFAVGVMVVETLTGRGPFHGASYGEMLASIVLEPYHFPGTTPETRALDDVLQRCLAKDPLDRFRTAAELRQALVPTLTATPAASSPPAAPAE